MKSKTTYPIIDLHCDLLHYLAFQPNATVHDKKGIGATLPYLKAGNVKLQVLAVFTFTEKGSVDVGRKEFDAYQKMLALPEFKSVTTIAAAEQILTSDKIGIIPAIENASVLADEEEPIENAFKRLDEIIDQVGHLMYIGFTHHTENRFGGGNYSNNVGLKKDGEALLDYMSGKKIAVDLSHASDNLAIGIMNHIENNSLDLPIIASHSNFRTLHNHVRNLPDDFVERLVKHKGLIGMNFLRAYIHDTDPAYFLTHCLHGLDEKVAAEQIAFGADFFFRGGLEKMYPERIPVFFEEHIDASKYPIILNELSAKGVGAEALAQMCFRNALDFIKRTW